MSSAPCVGRARLPENWSVYRNLSVKLLQVDSLLLQFVSPTLRANVHFPGNIIKQSFGKFGKRAGQILYALEDDDSFNNGCSVLSPSGT